MNNQNTIDLIDKQSIAANELSMLLKVALNELSGDGEITDGNKEKIVKSLRNYMDTCSQMGTIEDTIAARKTIYKEPNEADFDRIIIEVSDKPEYVAILFKIALNKLSPAEHYLSNKNEILYLKKKRLVAEFTFNELGIVTSYYALTELGWSLIRSDKYIEKVCAVTDGLAFISKLPDLLAFDPMQLAFIGLYRLHLIQEYYKYAEKCQDYVIFQFSDSDQMPFGCEQGKYRYVCAVAFDKELLPQEIDVINRVLDSEKIEGLHIILTKQSEMDIVKTALNLDEKRSSQVEYYIMEQES